MMSAFLVYMAADTVISGITLYVAYKKRHQLIRLARHILGIDADMVAARSAAQSNLEAHEESFHSEELNARAAQELADAERDMDNQYSDEE